MRKATRSGPADSRSICPLTKNPHLRSAADKSTAAIRANFPPGLSQPALRALAAAGYARLDQLAGVNETDLAKLHGMGPKALGILKAALSARKKSRK